jgi:hypothetical protein
MQARGHFPGFVALSRGRAQNDSRITGACPAKSQRSAVSGQLFFYQPLTTNHRLPTTDLCLKPFDAQRRRPAKSRAWRWRRRHPCGRGVGAVSRKSRLFPQRLPERKPAGRSANSFVRSKRGKYILSRPRMGNSGCVRLRCLCRVKDDFGRRCAPRQPVQMQWQTIGDVVGKQRASSVVHCP